MVCCVSTFQWFHVKQIYYTDKTEHNKPKEEVGGLVAANIHTNINIYCYYSAQKLTRILSTQRTYSVKDWHSV